MGKNYAIFETMKVHVFYTKLASIIFSNEMIVLIVLIVFSRAWKL